MIEYTQLLFILILQMSTKGKEICYLPNSGKKCDLSELGNILTGNSEFCFQCGTELTEKGEFEPSHLVSICDDCTWIEENPFHCRLCRRECMPEWELELPDEGWVCPYCSTETE